MNGFLQGQNGENSSTRLIAAVVVIGIIATWSITSIASAFKGTPQIQVPWEIVTLGIAAMAGKVANSTFAEQPAAK